MPLDIASVQRHIICCLGGPAYSFHGVVALEQRCEYSRGMLSLCDDNEDPNEAQAGTMKKQLRLKLNFV